MDEEDRDEGGVDRRSGADRRSREEQRRHRVFTRAAPIAAIALIAFVGGIVVAAGPDHPEVQRFVDAWESADYEAMYAELTPESQSQIDLEQFQRAYETAANTATLA